MHGNDQPGPGAAPAPGPEDAGAPAFALDEERSGGVGTLVAPPTDAGEEFWGDAGPAPRRRLLDPIRRLPQRVRSTSVEGWLTFAVLAGTVVLVGKALSPSLWVRDTLTTGGDTGAHVWGPAYLRDELLPHWRLSGWAPDWYAGFPAYRYYMVLPALAVVLLDVVMPYTVAFKLVTVAGVLAMPLAAYAFGRLARLPFPMPALLAAFTGTFLLDTNFSIYGGNIASTLAGEFSFTLSLSLGILYLGFVVRGLREGTHRGAAAVALAACGLCHPIPAFFALGGTVAALVVHAIGDLRRWLRPVWFLVLVGGAVAWAVAVGDDRSRGLQLVGALVVFATGFSVLAVSLTHPVGRRRAWWVASAGLVGGLVASFWVLPFWWDRGYVNDMGWEKLLHYVDNLFQPHETVDDGKVIVVFLALAGLALVVGLVRWDEPVVTLGLAAAGFGAAFVIWPQKILWNARLLPFWYLTVYLLAAIGVGYVIRGVARVTGLAVRGLESERLERSPVTPPGARRLASVGLVAVVVCGWWLHSAQPLHMLVPGGGAQSSGSWGLPLIATTDSSFVPSWARWNYRGVEGKPSYPDYYDLVTTMETVGEEHGCGRAMWEYGKDELERFGTPMAPMLLPYFTDGCIGSMEGLYFEASATTPYHFLMQDELSANPSRPMRDIPYPRGVDVAAGVDHMQLLGVRYYMAFSEETLGQAFAEPRLTPVAQSRNWTVFEVADTTLVEPLGNQPVVVRGLDHSGRDWTDPSIEWFLDPSARDVFLAAEGPDDWARIDTGETPERVELPAVTVSDVVSDNDSIHFSVDRVGVPVLVKTSYFPNWEASGADGPYRVTPNLMVVIPTERDVTLSFARSPIEYLGWILTVLGLALAVVLWRRPLDVAGVDDELTADELWFVGETGLAPESAAGVEHGPAPPFDGDEPGDSWPFDGDEPGEAVAEAAEAVAEAPPASSDDAEAAPPTES